jgi:hypothetical protein
MLVSFINRQFYHLYLECQLGVLVITRRFLVWLLRKLGETNVN